MAYTFNPSVQVEQKALNLKGANLKTDGFLGPLTLAARSKYSQGSTFPPAMQSNTITTSQLQPASTLNITGAPVDNTTPSIEGDMAYFQGIQNKISTEEQALQDQKASANTGIEGILKSLGGQGQEQLNLEQQYVNPLQTQIADITGQANVLTAEYKQAQQQYEKMKTDIEAGAGRKGITTGAVMGQQGAVARAQASDLNVKASEIGLLQAQSLALQGKADLAQKQVDRAIDLKYKAKEQELAIKQFQLEQIKEGLTAEQKKRFDAQTYALKKEEDRIAEAKTLEKSIQNMSIEAGKNGAPSSILSKLAQAKTFEEAIRIGGGYMTDPLDRSIKAAQLRKLNADITQTGLQNKKLTSEQEDAVVNSVVNEKDPTKLISNFFKTNPKIKTNQDINNAAGVVSAINNFSGTVGGGKIKGYGFLGGGYMPEAFKSQKGIQNKAQISSIEGKVQQWLSGAALSKAQEKLVNKMIPERNDNNATVRTKLNSLTNYMLGDIKGRATAQGAQFEYIPVDLFSKPDTSVQPDTKTSVVSAISAGYEPTEVIDFVSQNYPEQANKIQQARQAGYSDQEIIEYLSL